MEGNERITFWELLNEYSIEIPVIQRDYAQGRSNAGDIRKNFLESIKNALDTKTELDLNFVYGSTNSSLFTPIDGQQRLTTLYLLHVYIMLAIGKQMNKGKNKRIQNFTYETRTTSRDFCKSLTSGTLVIQQGKKISEVEKISAEIKNNNWFSSRWKNDPTISSMLTMLDSIHQLFKDADLSEYFKLLTGDADDDCPLYFYFLDLGEYNLGDSIYIKLNARGKDLTCYENFKAKLSKYLNDEISAPKYDYIAKLDGEWSDVFWAFREPETRLYDDKIMYFFINCLINEYAAHMTATGRDPVRKEITEIIGYTQLEFINRFQGYNQHWDGQKVADSLVGIFDLFDLMTDGKKQHLFAPGNKYSDEARMFNWLMEKHDSDYEERIQVDAYLGFILANKASVSDPVVFEAQLTDWMRVITTLSRETNYNGGDDYVRAISKGVRRLLPFSNDIITYLSGITEHSGYGFDADRFEEECIKAKLMKRDDEWKQMILDAEGNKYFNGQIGFLLEAAGIINKYENGEIDLWTSEEEAEAKAAFIKYLQIFGSIFGEFEFGSEKLKYTGINRAFANDFRRALLCKGDYHLDDSSNSSFLIDNDRDIGWKRLLRIQRNDRSNIFKPRQKMLLALVNDPLFDVNDIGAGLVKIRNRDAASITDWRRYFITVPGVMDALHDYRVYMPAEKLVRFEGDNIFLMGKTRLYGSNKEYYSYALYCMIQDLKKYDMEEYLEAKGWEDIDYQISFTEKNTGMAYKIKYQRSGKNFIVSDNNGTVNIYADAEEVLERFK